MSLTPFVHLDGELRGLGPGDEVTLTGDERHHLTTVLRLRPAAGVEIADGQGRRSTGVLGDGVVRLESPVVRDPAPDPWLGVVQALPKARKMDDIVRRTTELGVDRLVAATGRRSVARLEGRRAEAAVTRWRAVARAAAEQSRRSRRPHVSDVLLGGALPVALTGDGAGSWRADDGLLLIAHPGADPLPAVLAGQLDRTAHPSSVTVAIGPEGGWSDEDVHEMTAVGGRPVALGPTVLRTEHAAAAALAALAALLGRWG